MLDILPGKIRRSSQDTDSWLARGKTQMFECWNRRQSSVKAPQYSEQSQILLFRLFSDIRTHIHTSLTPQRGTAGIDDRMRWLWMMKGDERSPGELWSHQQDVQGSSEWKQSLQIFIQAGAAFPASIPHLFSHKLPISCPLLYHKQQTLPSPLHTALVNPLY